jgi:uncharacterized protein YjbI with pentapeptide repeats
MTEFNQLTPNKPIGRMKHVIKTYKDTARRGIIADVGRIALFLTGRDGEVDGFEERFDRMSELSLHPETFDALVGPMAEFMEKTLPPTHAHDAVIPWAARELGRIDKAIDRVEKKYRPKYGDDWAEKADFYNEVTPGDYREAVWALQKKAPVIGMWVEQEGIDLGKVDLATALEAVENFEAKVDVETIPQGEVVFEWNDDWTVQKLSTEPQLEVEGEVMQHCVGDYCEQVEAGDMDILSLRDPQGKPHVTMEWSNDDHRWEQIQGKQNEVPVEKYHPHIKDFVQGWYGDAGVEPDVAVLLRLGINADGMDFSGENLTSMKIGSIAGADFSGTEMHGVTLAGTYRDVSFHGADLEGTALAGHFTNCNFDTASLHKVEVRPRGSTGGGVFIDCSFGDASFYGSGLSKGVFEGCSFHDAKFERTAMHYTSFADCDFTLAKFADCDLVKTSFLRCNFARAEFDDLDGGGMRGVSVEGSDLTDVESGLAELLELSYDAEKAKLPSGHLLDDDDDDEVVKGAYR